MASEPRTPSYYAECAPERSALIMGSSGEVVTYRELEQRSGRLAAGLRSRGLGTGDHIAILMENNRHYLEVAWAAQRCGLYYTPINSHLRPREVQYVLDDCGAKALFASETMTDVIENLDLAGVSVRVVAVGQLATFERYDDVLVAEAAAAPSDECEGREMLYSSGTTGHPKGVRKPLPGGYFGNPEGAPAQIAQGMLQTGAESGATYLSPAPLYHGAPLVYSMSMHRLGGTVVVMEKFDARQCLELIERHRVTHAQFVPTMFIRMLGLPEHERYDHSSLRYVVHAAAPCPVSVKRQMLDWWGPVIHEYYSGTEDIGTAYITPEEWLAHPGSVGRPMDECHIVGADGTECSTGDVGVVYFAGGRPFEYHNDRAKTRAASNAEGWRTLGDMGYLDEQGYLYLTDRQEHVIISGGVNIYPQETENVLLDHPSVADVAVIGVPDDEMGESVQAVVSPAENIAADSDLVAALLTHCRAELASYKCPRTIEFRDELPRDPSGKLYKRLLRER